MAELKDEARFLVLRASLAGVNKQAAALKRKIHEALPEEATWVMAACWKEKTLEAVIDRAKTHDPGTAAAIEAPAIRVLCLDLLVANAEIRETETQIVALLEGYLRKELPPILVKTFGPAVTRPDQDGSRRFSELLNNFLLKVMNLSAKEHASEPLDDQNKVKPRFVSAPFFQAKCLRDLRMWSSVVIRHMVLDHIRRKKRGDAIIQREIAPLVAERARYLRERCDLPLDETLEIVDRWIAGPNERLRKYGQIFSYRYIDGMTIELIAEQVNRSISTVHATLERARALLKKHVADSARDDA